MELDQKEWRELLCCIRDIAEYMKTHVKEYSRPIDEVIVEALGKRVTELTAMLRRSHDQEVVE